MDLAIRQFLRDPIFGIPVLLLALTLLAFALTFLRSVYNGDAQAPNIKVFAADLAIIVMVLLLFVFSKLMDLFVPAEGTKVAGIDVAPLYSLAAPALFFGAGAALALWLVQQKARQIMEAARPPVTG